MAVALDVTAAGDQTLFSDSRSAADVSRCDDSSIPVYLSAFVHPNAGPYLGSLRPQRTTRGEGIDHQASKVSRVLKAIHITASVITGVLSGVKSREKIHILRYACWVQ